MSDSPLPTHTTKKIRSWDSLAEQRIQAAQAAGQFENLPGFGKPIPGIDEPHDELWWVKDKLKREQLSSLPPALAIRLDIQNTLTNLKTLTTESDVRRELASLNDRIRQASLAITWGPSVNVVPLTETEINDHVTHWQVTPPSSAASYRD
jgi:hypothetical protein